MWLFWWRKNRRRRQEAYAKILELGGVVGGDATTFFGVHFRRRPITDENLAWLAEFREIDHIDIEKSRVTDVGLRSLRGLRNLSLLYMADVQVGDEGLANLAGLRQLKVLDLSGTRVSDDGLQHLLRLKNLACLFLSRTGVTDVGVPYLKRLTNLRLLLLDETRISPRLIADLKSAIPSLRINPTDDEAAIDELDAEMLSRCPACDGDLSGEPLHRLAEDAVCPHCGQSLWSLPESPEPAPFGKFERMIWATLAVISTHIVWVSDQSQLAAILWLLGVLTFGQLLLPPVFRRVHDFVNANERFWLGVICGWGLVAGLPVGIFFGVLLPYLFPCGVPSWIGGIAGLVLGPVIAATEGLILASIVASGIWLVTGKSLARDL